MKTATRAIMLVLTTSVCTYAETLSYGWKSYIYGKVYETNAAPAELLAPSKPVTVQISKSVEGNVIVEGNVEPVGKCSMMQAIKLADLEAGRLIGNEYSGADPSWIIDKAERVRMPYSGIYEGCYYLITYREVIPRKAPVSFGGSLQVIILLDGKVLPIKPVEQGAP